MEAPLPATTAIYMDGKRYECLEKEQFAGGKHRSVLQVEEHIVVADAESGKYMGEFTPTSGSGQDVAQGLINFLQGKGYDVAQLKCIGGDTCAGNSGRENGAWACLERLAGRPMQRFACSLHLTELPLRHFARLYLGPTQGVFDSTVEPRIGTILGSIKVGLIVN